MIAGGLIGLATGVNKRDQANRDMNTMAQLYQYKQQDEKDEQLAEAQYQDMLAKVKQQANMLLDGDRVAVNNKALEYQREIKRTIKALGGSKKEFLKRGGIATLGKYKRDLLDSNEFQQFKSNKINMEKILMLKEKGMGHLLNNKDQAKLKSYEANGKGDIEYTGLLNEVDVDVDAYAFGHDITPEEVLKDNQNRMKIIANYEADTGYEYKPNNFNEDNLKA